MVAVTISWIAISIIFLSFGDILISLYNKLCSKNERYGITNTFLLGMCATLIPLSTLSFWLPSNQYILLLFLLLSIAYWVLRRKHCIQIFEKVRAKIKRYSLLELVTFVIPAISLMLVILWQVGVFDSLFYHQQNIRWNEEYAVVPGLGNLEHRFGFNSNYLLLSAIFSFRFLFEEAVYSLHVLVLLYIVWWIIKEIIDSGYEAKRIALLLVITGYIFAFGYSFTATSTDAIPNVVALYLLMRLLLYPDSVKKDFLLLIVLPVSLITFKISMVPLCIISLYIIFNLIKERVYKNTLFILSVSAIIVILWLARNVIVSGYLIFPFHEIDLFSVDWKIPKHVAIDERDFILSCGIRSFNDMIQRLSHWQSDIPAIKDWILYFSFLSSIIASPLLVIFALTRKRYLNKVTYFIYFILLATLCLWFSGGPDPRFLGGILFAVMYFDLFILLAREKEKKCRRIGITILSMFTLIMAYWPITRTDRFIDMFHLSNDNKRARPIWSIIYKQYPYRELLKSWNAYEDKFTPYQLGNLTIYTSRSPEIPNGRFVCFDSPFPCTVFKTDDLSKYQDITTIEARGNSLQDGFRSKE
ncbi:hypothetical protein [Dysgonomonas sp. BGC7]|uniref:LIC_10190 family membrane protein n=1 Tax=Dysgonomonas sp. BGC7 TaxID=1658008 RepID=UPI000B2BBD82|nr:hypothetical protein [Dysgonomonas sp. BGC7]MBD8390125.1 hypothetical protein [Dysgonomonas sp. BGC7]